MISGRAGDATACMVSIILYLCILCACIQVISYLLGLYEMRIRDLYAGKEFGRVARVVGPVNQGDCAATYYNPIAKVIVATYCWYNRDVQRIFVDRVGSCVLFHTFEDD